MFCNETLILFGVSLFFGWKNSLENDKIQLCYLPFFGKWHDMGGFNDYGK